MLCAQGCVCALTVTWLILPVVICLSQRLSHASLSSGLSRGETANGSLHQLWFLGPCFVTWITVGILELIHAFRLRLLATGWRSAFIRSKPTRACACHAFRSSDLFRGLGDSE